MRPLSATECINPAIDRTKLILFAPFRKGRAWKLCATAYLSRFGSMYLPFPLLYLAGIPVLRAKGYSTGIVVLIAAVLAVLALFTWVFHLCSRLQFAYFDMVANRQEFVAPAWSKYKQQALPWTLFKIIAGCVFTGFFSVPLLAFALRSMPAIAELAKTSSGAQPDVHLVAAIYAGYGLLLFIVGIGLLVFGLLSDFILPSLALENVTYGEAFRRMGQLVRNEPGEFALYVLLKSALAVIGYFGAFLAWELLFLIATLVVGGVVFLVGVALHAAGIPTVVLAIPGAVLAVLWYGFTCLYVLGLAMGMVLTFLNAYALYFLGGRYPMLGDLLDHSTPAPPMLPVIPYIAPDPPPLAPPA